MKNIMELYDQLDGRYKIVFNKITEKFHVIRVYEKEKGSWNLIKVYGSEDLRDISMTLLEYAKKYISLYYIFYMELEDYCYDLLERGVKGE